MDGDSDNAQSQVLWYKANGSMAWKIDANANQGLGPFSNPNFGRRR